MTADKLEEAIAKVNKQYGSGSIMYLGDTPVLDVVSIPTGSLALDLALGVGGIPLGRITEIYGPESSGKSTICQHTVAEAQKRGGKCAYIDMEHALDMSYAVRCGVKVADLLFAQPDTGEAALGIAEAMIRTGQLAVVVIDSVAALVPRAEIEGEMGDSHMGLQARLMSQALRKISGAIQQSNTAVIFTNQLRQKIGVVYGCFQYNTRITLADGTTEEIGKIVNQKMPVKVLSFDPTTGCVEPRQVVGWYNNGTADEFIQFRARCHAGNGYSQFACTSNHVIYTPDGYKQAVDINVGDSVLSVENNARSVLEVVEAIVDKKYRKPDTRSMCKFDLQVEGNHTYLADGVVVHNSPEVTTGGNALKFYASIRLDVRSISKIKEEGGITGSRVRVRVAKNKVAPPFREAEFDIMYNEGISREGDIVDLGAKFDVITKRGAFFSYHDQRLGQGRENAKNYLRQNPDMAQEIDQAIRAYVAANKLPLPVQAGESEADEE